GGEERPVGGGVVVSACASVDVTAEELTRCASGEPDALVGQMRLVGVPDVDREPGDSVRATPARGGGTGLGEREETLEPQRPLQHLRSHPVFVYAAPTQLPNRQCQLRGERVAADRMPRCERAHEFA